MGITQQINMIVKKEQVNALIEQGKKRGLTGKDVIDALVRKGYEPEGVNVEAIKQSFTQKTSTQTTPNEMVSEEPSVFERIKTGIEQKGEKVQEAISGTGEYAGKNEIERGVGATAQAFSAISGTVYNALPDVARQALDKVGEGIGGGINYLADKISNNPKLQEAVSSPEFTKNLESSLKVVSDLGLISGEILGTRGTVKTLDRGVDIIKPITEKVSNVTKQAVKDIINVPEKLVEYPSGISEYLSDKFTSLPPKVKNVLKTTSLEKFDNYVKLGEEAIKNPRALTPLEQAGDLVKNKVLPIMKEDLNNIGSQKSKSLLSVGTTQVPNGTLDIIDYIKKTTNGLKLTKDEKKLISQAISDLEVGANPTLNTLDKTVDLLQSTLFEKSKGLAIPTTSRVKSIINQSIKKLNDKVKQVASETLKSDEYSVLNDAYSVKKNLFNNVNKLLGEEGKKGGSLIKRFFSPQDSGIKKVFAKIKDLYGIDLAEDATLAKFVMDSLGDTRAASLLETVPLTKSGVATKAINYAYSKLQQPIKKARKTIVESKALNK